MSRASQFGRRHSSDCRSVASTQFLGNTRVLQAVEAYLNVEYEVTVPASSDAESVADSVRSLTNDTPRMSAFLSSLQTALAANADIDVTFASVRAPVVTVIAPPACHVPFVVSWNPFVVSLLA